MSKAYRRNRPPALVLSPRFANKSESDVVVVAPLPLVDAAVTWQERYEKVVNANVQLKQQLQELETTHRKALTTIKHERTLPNNDKFTKQLVEENRQLLAKYRILELRLLREKGRPALTTTLQGKGVVKKNKAAASKPTTATQTRREATLIKHIGVQADAVEESPHRGISPALQPLVTELKKRLQELELDLHRLRQENKLLQAEHALQGHKTTEYVAVQIPQVSTCSERNHLELQEDFQNIVRQFKILEARYQNLEEKARVKTRLYNDVLERMELLNTQLLDAQQEVVTKTTMINAHKDQQAKLDDLQKEIHLLRDENIKLNATIAMLNSRPFESLSVELQKRSLWIGQLEEEKKELQKEAANAKQDCKIARQRYDRLSERLHKTTEQFEALEEKMHQWKLDCELYQMERDVAQLQLRYYTTPPDKELMVAMGKALLEMKKKEKMTLAEAHLVENVNPQERLKETGFICSSCQSTDSKSVEIGTLQRERILKVKELTELIKEDAQEEIKSLKLLHAQEVQSLRRESKKWEKRASSYLEQIKRLQSEKGELLRRPDLRPRLSFSQQVSTTKEERDDGSQIQSLEVLSHPKTEQSGDLNNVMEIVFKELKLENISGSRSSRSYVLASDYYDFETQLSPVLSLAKNPLGSGLVAKMDFGITFKILQDESFFMSPLSPQMTIELLQVSLGNTETIAVAVLALDTLFLSPNGRVSLVLSIQNPYNEVVLGSLALEMSLIYPVDELYKAIVRNRNVRAHIKTSPSTYGPKTMEGLSYSQRAPSNQGTVGIRVISLLLMKTFISERVSSVSNASNIWLSYRFMGFPQVNIPLHLPLTPSVGGYFLAVDHGQTYQVDGGDNFKAFLQKYELKITLRQFISRQEPDKVAGHAMIPFIDAIHLLSTSSSCKGSTYLTSFSLYDGSKNDRLVGRVSIEIALSGMMFAVATQFFPVITRSIENTVKNLFGSKDDKYLINWTKFCAVMELSPLDRLLRVMIHNHLATDVSNATDVLKHLSKESNQLFNPFVSIDAFDTLLSNAGIRFSRMDLAVFISGLYHSCASENLAVNKLIYAPIKDDESADPQHGWQIQLLWNKLKLLCEMSGDEWLAIEDYVRARVVALGSLRSAAPVSNKIGTLRKTEEQNGFIPWATLQDRIGMMTP